MSRTGKTARVGVTAFAVGLALAAPHSAGIATADSEGSASVSANTSPSQSRVGSARAARATPTRPAHTAARRAPDSADAARSNQTTSKPQPARTRAPGAPGIFSSRDAIRPQPVRTTRTEWTFVADSAESGARPVTPAAQRSVTIVPTDSDPAAATGVPDAIVTPGDDPMVAPSAAPTSVAAPTRILAVASLPTGRAAATGDFFSALFGPIQSFIEGAALLIRRLLFNQAPIVSPIQTTGQAGGTIAGTIGAEDPEGDPLTYGLIDAPQYGSVDIGTDGSFVYTPGADFTGRDSFNVAVTDAGLQINLLDPFRPTATEGYIQVAQSAVDAMLTFSFGYGRGSQYWSTTARDALESAASQLAAYLVVTSPTTITYAITGESDPDSWTLASAGSDLTAAGPGFIPTVVQEKILTGVDSNGSKADGEIDWNFGNPWAFGTSVGESEFDFIATAMHELLHTFGFLSYTDEAGLNSGRTWTTFDQFVVNSDGLPVISATTYRFNTAYNPNLTGRNGGLYFGGPNAVAAYGGLVPIYTPRPWESGSSTSHLDDDTFTDADAQLMNAVTEAGPGIRVLSPTELGILKDLGYTVTDSPLYAFLFIGLGLLRRGNREPYRPRI